MLRILIAITITWLSMPLAASDGGQGGLKYIETAGGVRSSNVRELVQWTHSRLVFDKALQRVAVGQNNIMEVAVLNGNEVLLLAKEVGRTSLIAWYPDDVTETFLFSVVEDLSVLRSALTDIHPQIVIELAPDRNALVLRGTVPTMKFRVAAETAARNYLEAGSGQGSQTTDVVVKDDMNLLDLASAAAGQLRVAIPASASTSAIINLIQVEELPLDVEQKIIHAVEELGGEKVKVKRIRRGDVNDNARDTLLLSGTVDSQVALVRILNVASRLFVGNDATTISTVAAIADESGALIGERQSEPSVGNSLQGASSQNSLQNQIKANIGRAKLLSVAGGRILSMIEVTDLPQVRVSVQMHEVDRTRMRNWRPEITAVTRDFAPESMTSGTSGLIVQPDASLRIGATEKRQVENALQILGGTLSNQLQIGGSNVAFDLLFSLLENDGISRTLSKPTLMVLAGEEAVFQVGGEVPVPTTFAPAGVSAGDTAVGVFSGTEFKAFGVQLMVRAMVDERDRITLDVKPTISTPDATLTQVIAGTTGSALNSTAFTTRSLDTTTRLRDGQTLVIGGLVSRNISDARAYTPGLQKTPLLGRLAEQSQKADNDRELLIIVTPTIIREPIDDLPLWHFPDTHLLLDSAVLIPGNRFTGPQTLSHSHKRSTP